VKLFAWFIKMQRSKNYSGFIKTACIVFIAINFFNRRLYCLANYQTVRSIEIFDGVIEFIWHNLRGTLRVWTRWYERTLIYRNARALMSRVIVRDNERWQGLSMVLQSPEQLFARAVRGAEPDDDAMWRYAARTERREDSLARRERERVCAPNE